MCERRTVCSLFVLLFGVSWCWELLGVDWTFVLVIVPPVCSITPRWSYVSTTRRSFAPQGANMSRVWGGTAFAKRSGAMKAPVGLLSGSAVCDSRWRGVAPTSATPTRSLRKCRRIAEVKSRMDRKFSRIENLWPRDGSCPLPLRSKSTFDKCFRIVKAQKISRGGAAHVRGSPFAPNEVPAPVYAAALTKSRYHVRSAHEIFKVRFP